jgi:trigger factor
MSQTADGIQITKSKDEPGSTSFRVEVDPERVRRAEHQATQAFAKRARLPGFRKGKAPLAVVLKRYGDAIREQVLREVVGESWKATLEREKLDPIADPHVHDLKFEAGAPVTFELHVEVKPELTLERLGGFTVARHVAPVTDDTVAAQIEEIRQQRAAWVPVEGERAKPGDMVAVNLATMEEGAADEAKPYRVVLGQGQAIPDVEEQIMTLSVGETREADVRFPDDFADESKRGQQRRVRITLQEVKRQELPPLDDAFAREVGDFDSLDALRTAVRHDLEADARREADAGVRRQVIEQIVAANSVPAPRPLVGRLLRAYGQMYSVPDDRFEQFATEFLPLAEAQVRRDLVLDHVARAQNLKSTEEELDRRIAEIAKRRDLEPAAVYTELQKANRLKELEQTITEEKTFDYLLAQSTVTET